MLRNLSTFFLRTLREDPADAEVNSHKLLVRAGYIRRCAPGIYTWLPLGLRTLRKIEDIVREEMDAMGAQEVHFPGLIPADPYKATNRWEEYGPTLFKLNDRKGGDYLLAPTHEEMFTLLVKDMYSSYKDLPATLYQIQTKYRDEARPRAGLIRGREFVMKDAYSFDIDDEGLDASYQAERDTYERIFQRLGLRYVIVSAMSGAMGGSRSEEFLHPSPIGEDTFVASPGGYAANAEAVTTPVPEAVDASGVSAPVEVPTPDAPTIEALVDLLNERYPREDRPWTAADTLKNVVVTLTHPDGERELLVVGIPGDRDVDMKRLEAAVVREGDLAPDGSGPLHLERGIEIGHIFQLGRKYAKALGLTVLDENGKTQVVTMGSYGIGVTRVMAALAEANCDDKGLSWPAQIAPFDVHVLATGKGDEVFETAQSLGEQLDAAGLDVLVDDRRKVSAGVKFKDYELVGVPFGLVVGRSLADGQVEIRVRATGETIVVPVEEAVARLRELHGAALKGE